MWREIREGRRVVTVDVLSREEEMLPPSMDGCQREEGGTLRTHILECFNKGQLGCQALLAVDDMCPENIFRVVMTAQ